MSERKDIPQSFVEYVGDKKPSKDSQQKTRIGAEESTRIGAEESETLLESIEGLKEGVQFGRYTILREVGQGGMGKIYQAEDRSLGRVVALKLLLSGTQAKEEDKERFLREANAMAQLRHPNIVTVYDRGTERGQPFFTMDFIEGGSLEEQVAKKTPTFRQLSEWMVKIADAMHYAHQQGIVHRDLKPENVMFDNGEPRVMDFGLAKMSKTSAKLSRTGMILGTLQYMPPEQAQGRLREIDARSDVYSLGAILYELLTGQPTFVGKSSLNLVYQIINKQPQLPHKIKKSVPRELEHICLQALEKQKQHRYQSAEEFAADLRRFLERKQVVAKAASPMKRLQRQLPQRKYQILTGILAIGLVISLLFSFASNEDSKSTINNLKKSVKQESKSNAIDPEKSAELCNIGVLMHEKKKFDDALEYFEKAIIHDPQNHKAHTNMGAIYTLRNKFDKAIKYYNKALKIAPKNIDAYLHRAGVYKKQQQYNKSIADYKKILQLQPKQHNAHIELAYIYSHQKKYPLVIEYCTKALEIVPEKKEIYFLRSLAHLGKKDYDFVIQDCSEYLAYNPNHLQTLYNRGKAFENRGSNLDGQANKLSNNFRKLSQQQQKKERLKTVKEFRKLKSKAKQDLSLAKQDYSQILALKKDFPGAQRLRKFIRQFNKMFPK